MMLTLVCNLTVRAQQAETIESFIANSHEPEWYAAQAEAWQKKVDANPQDQWAWRNLFRATCYHDQFTGGWNKNQDESKTANVIRKMEATLPDSYVLNLSKGRFCLTTDSAAIWGDNIYKAIENMPEDAYAEDVNYLAADLTQDTFMRVWTARDRFSGASFHTWLLTIGYNLLKNHYRHSEHEKAYESFAVQTQEEAGDNAIIDQLDQQAFDQALSRLLEKMPSESRLLFSLRFEEELTVPQIAVASIGPATCMPRKQKPACAPESYAAKACLLGMGGYTRSCRSRHCLWYVPASVCGQPFGRYSGPVHRYYSHRSARTRHTLSDADCRKGTDCK
jgi:RNA polymerase sigma factor (sigma-70 family)